jgi:hypothetical protein
VVSWYAKQAAFWKTLIHLLELKGEATSFFMGSESCLIKMPLLYTMRVLSQDPELPLNAVFAPFLCMFLNEVSSLSIQPFTEARLFQRAKNKNTMLEMNHLFMLNG